jgi:1,4-alpha-glucan branching enzyme
MTSLGRNGSVAFRFFRPGAREVSLAGDFNDWSKRLPMRGDAHGWWTLELPLPPGDYRFRYVADGQWYTDFASNGIEVTKLGWNSVLVVPGADEVSQAGDQAQVAQRKTRNTQRGGALRVA